MSSESLEYDDEEHFQTQKRALLTSTKLTRVLRNTGNISDQSKKYLQPIIPYTEEVILGHEEWGLNITWKDALPSRQVLDRTGAKSVANCINDLIKKNVAEADICVLVENEEVRDRLSLELKELDVDNHNAEEQFESNGKNKVVVECIKG